MWHGHFCLLTGKREGAASHLLRNANAFALGQQKDRVDGVRIVDVVSGYARCIRSPARLRSEHFVEKSALLDITGKNLSFVDVLVADRRCEILPTRIFRV